MTFRELADELRPNQERYKMAEKQDKSKNEERIKRLWSGLRPIKKTVAETYLRSRGINILPEMDCYFHPGIDYYEDGESIGSFPCMVSIFRDVDSRTSTLHITYLDQDGSKLDVAHPKKIMPVIRPLPGCAIKLFPASTHIALAEGVETALAVYQDEGYTCWATGSAGNTEKIELPDTIKAVTIYVDEDENFAGAKSSYILANRLSIKGLRVRMCRLDTTTKKYEVGIKYDFLDYLNS